MGTTHGFYVPADYIRLCDLCGVRRNISALRKTTDNSFICDFHPEFKTAFELDSANRRGRAPREVPVPFPKPQDPCNPYTFIEEEGHLLGFVEQMTMAGARYLNVTSGAGSPLSGEMISTLGWSAYYLYGMIAEGKRPAAMTSKAETTLISAATTLQSNQVGFGITTTATRANNSAWGAFLEPSATKYETENAILGGLALLYAYRLNGHVPFLLGARAAASYLRNVQAIGKFGVHHTSTDSAGTGYLYTGSLCSEVSTAAGFYSNHLFYPSALLALVFWRELMTTDGDQQIGATAAVAGEFSQIPQQSMSTCMTDLRACWADGIRDSTNTVVNGLSAETPREYFNAYPDNKPNFTTNAGTGLWEFYDGSAATGTQITGQNWSKALHALYFYEGASDDVAALDDYLRSFESNADFETPAGTSDITLARSTTGEYEAEKGIATLLDVRDSTASYAAIAENGSSLYDWGGFGLLAALRSARHNSEFAAGRRIGVYVNQRWRDRKPSDSDHYDPLYTHGRSGLTKQTAFFGTSLVAEIEGGDPGGLPLDMRQWFRSDNVTVDGLNQVIYQPDLSGNALHADATFGLPVKFDAILDGLPGVQTGHAGGFSGMMGSDSGTVITSGAPRTIFTVCILDDNFGGPLYTFTRNSGAPQWNAHMYTLGGIQYGYSDDNFHDDAFSDVVDYSGVPIVVAHFSSGTAGNIEVQVNQQIRALTPNTTVDEIVDPGFTVMGRLVGLGNYLVTLGYWFETLVWEGDLRDDPTKLNRIYRYLANRYPSLGLTVTSGTSPYTVRDCLRAAQVGLSFRQQPIANRYAGT